MLNIEHLTFGYNETPLLTDVSLSLPRVGAFCFSGPSGCGKTTLLRLIAGLERPQHGRITLPESTKIATVFQENRLLPWLTVKENIELICDDEAVVCEALKAVSLWDAREQYPDELSGGMQRRAAIARAYAYGGDLLILDEPFTGLDEALCRSVAAALNARFDGKLILLVTHSDSDPLLFDATLIPLSPPITGPLR